MLEQGGFADVAVAPTALSAERTGPLVVPSSKITEGELRNIERVLLNPPAKVNWVTVCTSFIGAAYVAIKALPASGAAFPPSGLAVFAIALLVMGGVAVDTWLRARQKDAHYEAALAEVRKLIAAQAAAGSSQG